MKIRIKRSLLSFLLIMVLLLSANLSYSIIAQKTGIAPVTTAQAATYSNSPLVTYTNLTANHSGTRNHVIDTITIHSMAAPWTGKRCADYFANETTAASSNYCIGKDGDIALSVEEKNRSWATSSSSNDNRAITIEVATTTAAQNPNYPCTDAAYNALINLLVDICQRNNIKKLLWKNDKSLIGNVAQQNMTVHQWYANKACPGRYLLERHGAIADAVNARLAPDVSSCEHRNDWNSILVSFNVANNNYSQTGQNLPLDKIIYTDASGNDKLNVEGGGAFWIDANHLGIRTPSPAVGDKITLKAGFQWGSLTLGSDTAYTITALNSACSPNLKVKSFNHSNDWNSFIVEFATPNNNYSVAGTDLDTSKLVYTSSAGVDKSARGWFWLDSTHLGIRTEGVNAVAAGDIVAIKSGFVWGGSSVAHDIVYTANGANQGCTPGGTISGSSSSGSSSSGSTGGSSGSTGSDTTVFTSYAVRINTVPFNVYASPSTSSAISTTINAASVFTIVEEATGNGAIKWGKLKSGAGWVILDTLNKADGTPAVPEASTQPTTYAVTFNSNGGSSVASQTVNSGSVVTKPADPTKDGYTFVGWYTNSELTDEFDFSAPITANTTLYAKWQQIMYNVAFNSNEGSSVSSQTIAYNGTATKPTNPTKSGYTFVGWYKDSALTTAFNFSTPITADTTLYAKWQQVIVSYSVSFNSNGGSSVASQTINSGSLATRPTNPTKTGYTFVGWYKDSALTNQFNFNTPITANTTLYAKWQQNAPAVTTYTVTFNSNGGSNVANQTINSGALATKPASPTKAGYTFVGWYTNSELTDEFDFSAPITANTTLYAKWQQIMYNVAFNSNEGSSVSSQTITYGGTVTRPTNPTKTGYTFVGWYNDSALTDEFDFSSPITEDTTLYAKWQQVVYRYTVTFNSNGGSNVITQTVNGGGLAIIPNNPTKDGYTFAGWYKDSALTSEFNFNTPITANTTLYAKWQKNADEGSESTISCNSNVAGTSIGISLSALLIAGCIIVAKRKSKQK